MDDSKQRVLLLVDDEDNILRSLQRLFRREGYRILTATSGAEGLSVLEQEKVGVIISDQRMPSMTGTEFLERVNTLYPDTVRIILSGYTDLESVTDSINRGAIYKFLTKPWEDELLSQNVREAFRVYELNAENIQLTEALKLANEDLERRVEQKTRELRLNLAALKISHDILEELPITVVGISEGTIILANRRARMRFEQSLLLGQAVEDVCPAGVTAIYKEALNSGSASGDMLINGEQFRCQCQRNTSEGPHSGFILTLRLVQLP